MTNRRLPLFLVAVSAIGLALVAVAVARSCGLRHSELVPVAVMLVVLVVGEMSPIPVARGDDAGDEISISSTVACAMLFLAPLGVVMLAQALALIADETAKRRMWLRLAFNIAQYSLALFAMNATLSAFTSAGIFDRQPLAASDLGIALVATIPFFLVNNGLTGVAVALKLRQPLRRQLLSDIRWQLSTTGVLLALAPVLAQSVLWSVWTLPLLLAPLFAVHRSARLAFAREHEALHDALTGLPNRTLLGTRLHTACRDAERSPLAVMLLDLDHFKDINDTLGHQVGDKVIVEVARRLQDAVRARDFVARLGGDEFAVLGYDITTAAQASELAGRLYRRLVEPLRIDDARLDVGCSIGVALAPLHGTSAELLMREADVALYAAKQRRGSVAVYEPVRDESSLERLSLVNDLRRALDGEDDADELFVAYQPQCDAVTGRVVAVEALVRWRHPRHGMVAPDLFVPLAENTGLIDQITERVLADGLVRLAAWRAAGVPITLAVNLSARQLDGAVARRVAELLDRHLVPASALTIELTESTIMSDAVAGLDVLAQFRDLGVRLSIDDFGTGYSSLAYLKRLHVDEIKIDRSFILGLTEDDNDAAIVRATVELGHHFGLLVVAEGVEDVGAWRLLERLGCDVVQGYHISPPLPPEEISEWLSERFGCRPPVPVTVGT